MVDLLDKFKDKPEPLAKKADRLNVPKPTNPNIASSLGSTSKQAEMAPSPQSQQKQVRTEQLKAQAPREVADADSTVARAKTMMDSLANFNQANITDTTAGQIAGSTVDAGTARNAEDIAGSQASLAGAEALDSEEQISNAMLGEDGLDATLTLTVGELQTVDPELYTEITSYAKELGLDDNATLEQIKAAVDTEITDMTAVVDNTRATISDPNATPLERQQAAQLMRDYGASHLIATDAQLDDFSKEVSSVGVITIDGQTLSLEDVADNEAVAATVLSAAQTLLDNPDASPEDLGLQDNPQLYAFVSKHTPAILSVLDADAESLKTAQEAVATNSSIMESAGPELSESLGLDKFSTTTLDVNNPNLKYLTEDPNQVLADTGFTQDQIKESLTTLAGINPDGVKDWLQNGTPTQLNQLVERAADIDAVKANNFKVASGATSRRIRTLIEDSKVNKGKYSEADIQALEYYNDPNFKEKLIQDMASGKEIPQLSSIRTLPERQKSFIDRTVRDIDRNPRTVSDARRTVKDVNKALSTLLKISNPPPMVRQEIKQLRNLKKQAIAMGKTNVTSGASYWVRDTDNVPEPVAGTVILS